MASDIKVAIVGLDTSHSIEFTRRMQAPDCPADQFVPGLRAITCLRFETPFQDKAGLDDRQKQMEEWGVKVTENFKETIADCDAIMIEINDPAFHLEYFEKCAALGKPVFLDKPFAANMKDAQKIVDLMKANNTRMFSSSSFRFSAQLFEASTQVTKPTSSMFYGSLGIAPAGSSVVWYGVHTFEMLVKCMGIGASKVTAIGAESGVISVIEYKDGRKGIVDLTIDAWAFGGVLRDESTVAPIVVDTSLIQPAQLREIRDFFAGGPSPVSIEDTLEVTALLEAAENSLTSDNSQLISH